MKRKSHIESFLEHTEKLNISDVSDSKIIVGNRYTIEKYDTKVVVIEIDDDKKKAFVTCELLR